MKKITKEKIENRLICLVKNFTHIFGTKVENTKPIFILGSGRSGTTMLFRVFERDFHIQTFGENHPAIARNYLLNYNSLSVTINSSKFDVVVLKPILNSFDVSKLLSMFPNGIFIWMIRDYRDVVASALKKFGPVVADYLKNYIEYGRGDNWISKGMPTSTRNSIIQITKGRNLNSAD